MVSRSILAVLALSISIAVGADEQTEGEGGITYPRYRSKLSEAEAEIDYRKRILKTDELHLLLDDQDNAQAQGPSEIAGEEGPPAEAAGAIGEKEGEGGADVSAALNGSEGENREENPVATRAADATATPKEGRAPAKSRAATVKTSGRHRYVPPSALNGEDAQVQSLQLSGDDFTNASTLFGITIGTAIRVRMDSTASNVQPGFVVLEVLEDVVGDKKPLTAGSQLFGIPSAVKGSSRLYVNVAKGITTDHDEFTLRASINDARNEAGLVGSIVSDGKLMERSVAAGTLAFGSAAASLLPADIATSAIQAGTDNALSEKRSEGNAKLGAPAFIVVATPQEAFVYVEETF